LFRLSVVTDEISQDLFEAVAMAREFNLSGVELRSVWERNIHELTREELKRVRQITADAGIEVCCIASPLFKCSLDSEDEYNQHLRILRKSISATSILGAHIIRGFTFWRAQGTVDWIAIQKRFQEPTRILEGKDVTLGIENEPSTNASNGMLVASFLRKLDNPAVKAVWDPCNDLSDPSGEEPFPEGYRRVRDFIAHVHLKDAKRGTRRGEAESTLLGDGDLDLVGQLGALKSDNYSGYISLETHYRPKRLDEGLLRSPKGSAFSHLGAAATRESLERLLTNLKRV
jgi:L-ribulose-5-phosphate 3-epimerase